MQWLLYPSTKPRDPCENYFQFGFAATMWPFVKLLCPLVMVQVLFETGMYYAVLNCYCCNREDEDEDIEETIQKRRGRRKKKKKAGKIAKKEKEVIEEVKPPEQDYEQTGMKICYLLLQYVSKMATSYFWNNSINNKPCLLYTSPSPRDS